MTTTHLKQFLQQPYPGKAAFLRHVLEPLFGAENVHDTFDEPLLDRHPHLLSMARTTGIRAITRMAHVDLGVEPLDIFDVAVSDRVCMSRNRVGVQQLVRRIMDTYTGAFLLIHYEDRPEWEWRFTFCHKTHDAASGTSARRFTFLLGPGQACRTAAENFGRLIDRRTDDPDAELYIDDLRQAFSVEALSREFFARYKAHYQAFVDFMVSDAPMRQDFTGTPQPADTPEARHREEKPIRDYVKKLLGRIVFLHFLQKKRWLGVPLGAPWGEGPADFLHRLFQAADADQQADFLDGTLEPLFDRGLDTDRRAAGDAYDTGIAAIGTVRIPWLSGGLFERDRLDRLPSRFPPELFRDLFEMLAEYNFTVDENDPDDAEVGVDPEMLGRIFENLLENNNDTGAFYTPKEVVRYMCRESLLAHLVATLPGVDAHTLRALVESHNVEQLPAPLAEKIDRALADVKICDPAIGSGAFPMGLLRLLFACRTALTPLLEGRRTAADLKRHIIRHNIYGVDIERGAVDIARLRFWLALVVDAPEPLPLPHLDYKIMQGDSLLERIADVDLSHIAEAGAVAPPVQQDLFGAVDLDAARVGFATAEACATFRRNLERAFDTGDHEERLRLRTSLHRRVASAVSWSLSPRLEQARRTLADLDAASAPLTPRQRKEAARLEAFVARLEPLVTYIATHGELPPTECFLWHTWFRDVFEREGRPGFDIVIGNPPYIQLQANGSLLATRYAEGGFVTLNKRGDIYSLFYELSRRLLAPGGHLCLITSNKWMRAAYGAETRRFLAAADTDVLQLLDFAGTKLFENATVDANILLAAASPNRHATQALTVTPELRACLTDSGVFRRHAACMAFPADESWVVLSPIEASIKRKIEAVGTPLREWDIHIYRGVLTGCNEAFIIPTARRDEILAACRDEDERRRTAELIRPILRGRDIKRYGYEWAELWLIATFPSRHYDIEQYPAVRDYLLSFGREKLEQTGATYIRDGQEFKARKKTNNQWFETQDSISYWEDFDKPKIIYPNMTKFLPFYYDENGYLTNQKCFIVTGKKLGFLTAFLNSSLFKFCFRENFPELLGGTRELSKVFFDKLPILLVDEDTNAQFAELVQDIQQEYTTEKAMLIDECLFNLYDLTEEERKACQSTLN